MTKAAFALNPDNLPHRMTAAQVCELAGCSATTLWRRRRLDPTWLPAAPVQLGKSTMFDRAAVLVALCLAQDAPANDQWNVDPDAIREARARKVRHPPATQGRDRPRAHGGPVAAPALRLVRGDPASR